MLLEEKIRLIIGLLKSGGIYWLRSVPSDDDSILVARLLDFINQGKEKGFSTFFTYKKSLEIIDLVENDLALALLSPNNFVRLLAETLRKRSNNGKQTNDLETTTGAAE